MLNRWQKTVVDQLGNVVPWAALIIRREADQMPATVYRDREGTDPYPAGQVVADGSGFAYFYTAPGLYRITGQNPAIDWRDVGIGAPFDPDALGTAAGADLIESRYDATPGRVVTVGGFGVGVPGDEALAALDVDLDTVLISGDYYCADTCDNLPGALPGFLSVFAGSDPDRKLQRFVEDIADGKEYRRIVGGTPGVEWQESGGGSGGGGDPWAMQAIGKEFSLHPNAPLPPTDDPSFRYIILTAGLDGAGQYNEGVLTDETVTGSDPTITATAVVSLAGSPMDGQTIDLINTSRVFPRPGPAAGPIVDSANINHTHAGTALSAGAHTHTISAGSGTGTGAGQNSAVAGGARSTGSAGAHTHNLAISPTGTDEARPRYIPRIYLMRIL
ncbi:hypothetical protein [Castellaniella sp.]|uniref:hypothetical protein n=1 Tax=Castellaniella sp. TaxID=1955812 RepID=UPI002AFE54EB|nr:hypothetical protein [Castellaniella sp.]